MTAYGIELVPLIIIIVGLFINYGLPKKFAPLIAIVIGTIFAFLYSGLTDWREKILLGLVMGLNAVGLHSGLKNMNDQITFNLLKREEVKQQKKEEENKISS